MRNPLQSKTSLTLHLYRQASTNNYTMGSLYMGKVHYCDTLEDPVRQIAADGTGKVPGVTAIPAGRYSVRLSHSIRFGKVLPEVMHVPHFTGIRIHAGNTAKDTEGCILVGLASTKKGYLKESRKTFAALMQVLQKATAEGKKVWLTITDN